MRCLPAVHAYAITLILSVCVVPPVHPLVVTSFSRNHHHRLSSTPQRSDTVQSLGVVPPAGEGEEDLPRGGIGKRRSRQRKVAAALAANFVTCVWAGICLGSQAALATTTTSPSYNRDLPPPFLANTEIVFSVDDATVPSTFVLRGSSLITATPELLQFTLPKLEIVTPLQASSLLQEKLKERDSIEAERSERYTQLKRQKAAEKEEKLREYDEMFQKDQEERDRFYGQKALEARRGVEELKREEREGVQRGIFSGTPLQIPEESGGVQGEVANVKGEDGGVAESKGEGSSVTTEEKGNAVTPLETEPTPLERRTSVAAKRRTYSDEIALRKAREEVARLEQKVASESKLEAIRSVRREEEELVRQRAEVNAMKLRRAKEWNAEIRAEKEEELRERQREKMEGARELRKQAEFERRMDKIDTFVLRKEKIEEGKIERSLQK